MPTYDYECKGCGKVTEEFFQIKDKPSSIQCSCGKIAVKILGIPMVIGEDMPPWMTESITNLQGKFERPIESRSEYNRYLTKKGISEISASEG